MQRKLNVLERLQQRNQMAIAHALRTHERSSRIKNLFQTGKNKGINFTPTSGVATNAMAITGWDWDEKIDKVDITNTNCQGLQALLAAILRGTGKVTAFFDSANLPWAATPSIMSGQNGLITFIMGSPNTQWSVPCMVTDLHTQSEVDGGVKYDFTVELNCLSGPLQAFVGYNYPT